MDSYFSDVDSYFRNKSFGEPEGHFLSSGIKW